MISLRCIKSFNPFQGFIRVFTAASFFVVTHGFQVLIPSRDLLGFSLVISKGATIGEIGFNPFQGFIRVFTFGKVSESFRNTGSFNPFQGFIRVFTNLNMLENRSRIRVLIPSRDLLGFSQNDSHVCNRAG